MQKVESFFRFRSNLMNFMRISRFSPCSFLGEFVHRNHETKVSRLVASIIPLASGAPHKWFKCQFSHTHTYTLKQTPKKKQDGWTHIYCIYPNEKQTAKTAFNLRISETLLPSYHSPSHGSHPSQVTPNPSNVSRIAIAPLPPPDVDHPALPARLVDRPRWRCSRLSNHHPHAHPSWCPNPVRTRRCGPNERISKKRGEIFWKGTPCVGMIFFSSFWFESCVSNKKIHRKFLRNFHSQELSSQGAWPWRLAMWMGAHPSFWGLSALARASHRAFILGSFAEAAEKLRNICWNEKRCGGVMPFQHMYVADLKLQADKVADFYVTQSMTFLKIIL